MAFSGQKRFRSSPSFSQATRVCAWDGWRANCGQSMEVSSKLDPTISEHPEERKHQSGVASICEILAMEIFKQQLLCGCSRPIHEKTSWMTRCELTTRSENARRPRGAGPLFFASQFYGCVNRNRRWFPLRTVPPVDFFCILTWRTLALSGPGWTGAESSTHKAGKRWVKQANR